MFLHNLKYTIKTIFRNKTLIFWTFAFPIILGFLFNMAFSDIESDEVLKAFDIAIINNDNYKNNDIYKEVMSNLSNDNENKIFNIKYTTIDEAKEMLDDNKIEGYLYFETNTPKITIKKSGINQTILKFIVEEVELRKNILNNIVEKEIKNNIEEGNFEFDTQEIINSIMNKLEEENITLNNVSNSNLSYMMIEYYTLIAMACLYGAMIGLTAINQSLADAGNIGKRSSITPTKKIIIVLSKALGAYIVSLVGITLLMLFLHFILKADFGNNLLYIILLALLGTLAGTSFGVLVASAIKSKEEVKTGIILAISMLLTVLAGMMGVTLKYVIDKNVPIINILNPANMITDGFYALYYYNTLDRYWFNIISLLIFSIICIIISSISIRREKYDSI